MDFNSKIIIGKLRSGLDVFFQKKKCFLEESSVQENRDVQCLKDAFDKLEMFDILDEQEAWKRFKKEIIDK